MIRKQSPGLKMIVSYADALEQGHLGIIYQASNWAYLGVSKGGNGFIIEGVRMHNRSIYSRGWKQQLQWLREHIDPNAEPYDSFKHRYGYGLTPEMRAKLSEMSLPYPKAPEASSDVPGSQSGEGGATPTPALN